jgi:MFS family permease
MYLIIVPVIIPYFMNLGLTMTEIFFIQGMFGFSMAVFEVPSAYLGDLWGRKKILLLGTFISGASFTLLIYATNFWSLLIYEIILAIGASFVSGADLAIMYDSLGDDRKAKVEAVGNFHGMQLLGESAAALTCSALMYHSYMHVIWAQFFVGWIPFVVAIFLIEPKIERMRSGQHKKNLSEVFCHIFMDDRKMRMIFMNMVIWSVATFCAIWIIQKYWQEQNVPIYNLGILWAICNITAAITGKLAPRLEITFGVKPLLILMSLLPVVAYITMGLAPGLIGIGVTLCFYISRGLNMVIMKEAFNHRIPDRFRNTANSLNSLFFRMIFFVLGPLIGLGIDHLGMSNTLIIMGCIFGAIFILITIPFIRRVS